jgi:hypothetical protein
VHPKPKEKLEVLNFQITPGGDVSKPILKFNYRNKTYGPADILNCLNDMKSSIVEICEFFIAYTISYNIKKKTLVLHIS